ncbi:DUF5017 domain-containing protein [Puteibacter caeruleilacunae]|nr:DUF5017 domain-containing protein [Puteibacter caeruleilacunae]
MPVTKNLKHMKYLYIFLMLVVVISCSDDLEVPKIDNSTIKISSKANETIEFTFDQQSDLVSFYSGEPGHDYNRKDSIYAKGSLQLVFTSKGEWDGRDQFMSLWYSKNYVGIDSVKSINFEVSEYTKSMSDSLSVDSLGLTDEQVDAQVENLVNAFRLKNEYKTGKELFQEATWEQVPDVEFGKCQHGQGGDWITTTVDLKSYSSSDAQKVTFAFRNYDGGTTMGNYFVKDYKVQVISDVFDGGKDFRTSGDGMENVTMSNETRYWKPWNTGWCITGGQGWYSSTSMDSYALMFPLDLTQIDFPIPGDRGIPVSSFVDQKSSFEYSYSEPGNYTATFVFTNVDQDGKKKSVTKTYNITVSE